MDFSSPQPTHSAQKLAVLSVIILVVSVLAVWYLYRFSQHLYLMLDDHELHGKSILGKAVTIPWDKVLRVESGSNHSWEAYVLVTSFQKHDIYSSYFYKNGDEIYRALFDRLPVGTPTPDSFREEFEPSK